MYPKRDRLEDPKYRVWVQQKPCLISNTDCSCQETVAPHHIFGGHGRKDDKEAVPLCNNHHAANASNFSVHHLGRERFEELHQVNMLEAADKLYKEYGGK